MALSTNELSSPATTLLQGDPDAAFSAEPLPSAPPAFAIRAALRVRRFLQRLADRVVPANVALLERSLGLASTALLGAVAEAGVADLLEREGPLDAAAIARRTGTNADAMHRTLRALASTGVFALEGGRFENNRLSRALLSGTPFRTREWASYFASASNVDAWKDIARSIATGRSAFPRVHGKSVWAWFDAHPNERETFARAMMGITYVDAPVVATAYPWHEVTRVCDVGGGRGLLLSEILVRNPHLTGILCDAPGVIASARSLLERRGVVGRVQCVPGSFFESVPAGADAYVMKSILHDWDDAACETILRAVRRATKPGQKVILAEQLVERDQADGIGPLSDVQMLAVCDDGRERSRADFERLLRNTGFRMGRVFPFPTTSLIEGVAV